MTTLLRRFLAMAFVAALAGLGVFTALLARKPRKRLAALAEVLVPIHSSSPTSRRAGGGRGLAIGLVCLLLLMGSAGIVYESRDVLFGGAPREPNETAKPLAALSPPDAGTAGAKARANGTTTGSVQAAPTGDDSAALQPPRQVTPTAPGFDVVRIEPNGDAVIAGHATPNATVELLVDGKPLGSARANADGRFTFMPPTLPTGNSEIGLRATSPEGGVQRSSANVSVVVAPARDAKPLVAVTSPDRPTMILSQPDRPGPTPDFGPAAAPGRQASRQASRDDADDSAKRNAPLPAPDGVHADLPHGSISGGSPMTGAQSAPSGPGSRSADGAAAAATPPQVVSIDAQGGGKLFVSARAAAGAEVRLYLNDTLIAPATVGRDGTVTFAIGRGVRTGDYRVRLDLVDPATGKVRDRAEVPFSAPAAGREAGVEYSAGNDVARRQGSVDPATPPPPSRSGSPAEAGTSEVYVPGIETARIERGDSLWRISRRAYGEGERYSLIYDANQNQIRDPDLIYPGQVFVLPKQETSAAEQGRTVN